MSPLSSKKSFQIQSDSKNLQSFLRGEIAPLLLNSGLDEKTRQNILVALGEAITNSIRHSYHCEPQHPIDITFEEDAEKLTFLIRDYGETIDPAKIKAKETPKLPPDTPGGLGIYFMKTIMDTAEYNTSHSQGNELRMTKRKKGVSG